MYIKNFIIKMGYENYFSHKDINNVLIFTINSNNKPFCNHDEDYCLTFDFWQPIKKIVLANMPNVVCFLGQENNRYNLYDNFLGRSMESLSYELISNSYEDRDENILINYIFKFVSNNSDRNIRRSYIKDFNNEILSDDDDSLYINNKYSAALCNTIKISNKNLLIINFNTLENRTYNERKKEYFYSILETILDTLGKDKISYIICGGSFNFEKSYDSLRDKSLFSEGINNLGISFPPTCILKDDGTNDRRPTLNASISKNISLLDNEDRPLIDGRFDNDQESVSSSSRISNILSQRSEIKNKKTTLKSDFFKTDNIGFCDRIIYSNKPEINCIEYNSIYNPDTNMKYFKHAIVYGLFNINESDIDYNFKSLSRGRSRSSAFIGDKHFMSRY